MKKVFFTAALAMTTLFASAQFMVITTVQEASDEADGFEMEQVTNNIGLGSGAVDSISTGDHNVGLGVDSLTAVTSGGHNVGVGRNTLKATTTATYNTAVGDAALDVNFDYLGVDDTLIDFSELNGMKGYNFVQRSKANPWIITVEGSPTSKDARGDLLSFNLKDENYEKIQQKLYSLFDVEKGTDVFSLKPSKYRQKQFLRERPAVQFYEDVLVNLNNAETDGGVDGGDNAELAIKYLNRPYNGGETYIQFLKKEGIVVNDPSIGSDDFTITKDGNEIFSIDLDGVGDWRQIISEEIKKALLMPGKPKKVDVSNMTDKEKEDYYKSLVK